MQDKYRKSGIDTIGDIPWGTHICQLYHTKDDLTETLVPYFKAGLENNEFCMWVTSEPLGVEDAKESLGKTVRDLGDYISKGQIEILDYSEWYTKWGKFNAEEVSHSWVEKEMKALEKGFGGLRLAGNTFWLGAKDWVDLREYEAIMDSIIIGEHRMIAICTYPLDKCKPSEVLDVMNNHETTLTKQKGLWRTVESNERKRLKRVLSASETRYRRLFETAQDGIIILDADTESIIDVNPFLVDMLGYSHEKFLGKKLWEIGTFQDIELSKTAFQELQRKGYVRYEDLPLETKGGKQISVEFVSNIYEVDHKRVIQCNIRNITDRKQVEEALEKSRNELEIKVRERTAELAELNRTLVLEVEERKRTEKSLRDNERKYRTLVQNIPQAIFVKDRNSVYISCNDNYARDLKIESEEITGKTDYEFHPRDLADKYRADDRRIIETQETDTFEEKYVRDGQERTIQTVKTPVRDDSGNVAGVLGIFQDITEHKMMEEELRKIDKLESVGILAGGIAHDFNNIITGILGNISMAKRYVEEKGKAFNRLVEAERACLRARDLTQQLLTFSKGGTPNKKLTSMVGLLKESATLAIAGSNVRTNFKLPDDLWVTEIDEGQIHQAINNIVLNSIQAMPQGGIINISAKNLVINKKGLLPLPKGNYIDIAIEDHGIGILREHLDRMFEPYFTTKQKGSGLGLATTYSIIKNHGGHTTIESTPTVGTIVHIYLPATKKRIRMGRQEEAVQPSLITQARVLVMDDEEIVRNLLRSDLTEIGYEVKLAQDGAEAIEHYVKAKEAGRPFDVVIMDLTVPGGMGGKEAIKKLLEIDPDAKVIVSSGYATDPVLAKYKEYGFSGAVAKPYRVSDLEKTLHDIWAHK